MKIKLLIATIFTSIGLMSFAQSTDMKKMEVMIENQSRFGFAETVDVLSKYIAENNWKITAIHDMQETMKKNGKEVLPVKVCRISVYEKTDGKTYVSRMNAPAFAAMIGGDAAKTMVDAFNETEELLLHIINK